MSATVDHPVQIQVTSGAKLWCTRGHHNVAGYNCFVVGGRLICQDHVRWVWWPSGEEYAQQILPSNQHRAAE